jgi:hypothetical protein
MLCETPMCAGLASILIALTACRDSTSQVGGRDAANTAPPPRSVIALEADDASTAEQAHDGEVAADRVAEVAPIAAPAPARRALAYGHAAGRMPRLTSGALSPDGANLAGIDVVGRLIVSRPIGAPRWTRQSSSRGCRPTRRRTSRSAW